MANTKAGGIKTAQRIKLRLHKHPVKLDATILEMAADGSSLKVRFDGPLEDLTLYRWNETVLVTKKLGKDEGPGLFTEDVCQIWEVL